MKQMRKTTSLLVAALTLAAAGTASATNGYFTHGTGTKNKAMAGAGIAGADDAISVANNPAAAVFATGKFDAGAALFSPLRSYSSSTSVYNGAGTAFTIGPNDLDSDRDYFVIPHIARSWAIGSDSAFAVAFYGRGGMNTKWVGGTASFSDPGSGMTFTVPGTFGGAATTGNAKAGVDLSQAFLDLTYARKAGSFAWGVGLVVAVQSFEAYGVGTFAPFTQTFAESGGMEPPENLSDNGHEFSTGFGGKLGFQAQLGSSVTLAAMYQSEIGMSELDDYHLVQRRWIGR